jgi:cutinase
LIPSLGSGLSDSTSGSGISSLLGGLSKRQLTGSITANDVTDKASCKELTFIFARGSDEMGNMGSVVGPPVATQLKSLTGNKVNVQGVTYAATAEVSANPSVLFKVRYLVMSAWQESGSK